MNSTPVGLDVAKQLQTAHARGDSEKIATILDRLDCGDRAIPEPIFKVVFEVAMDPTSSEVYDKAADLIVRQGARGINALAAELDGEDSERIANAIEVLYEAAVHGWIQSQAIEVSAALGSCLDKRIDLDADAIDSAHKVILILTGKGDQVLKREGLSE